MTAAPSSAKLRVTVAGASVAALAVLILCIPRLTNLLTVAGLCALAVVASLLRSVHSERHTELVFVVLGAVYVVAGPEAAVVITAVASLAQPPAPRIKRVFNSAQRILSSAAGASAYSLVGGPVGDEALRQIPEAIGATTLATVALLTANAFLIALVLLLERGAKGAGYFLRHVVPSTAPPMAGYALLGLLMAVVWLGGLNILAGVLILVPMVVARWALSQDEAEKNAQSATMQAFIQVIEAKDFYTRGHSERVSQGVGMLGRHLQLPEDRQHALENAGLLHDCGKVGVPTSTLRKAGKLDDTEWDAIRLHPARGVELIGDIPFLEEVKSAVLHHHEKYDGTGYPAGLSGKKIPYFARMIGIVDAFDCLTSTRPYRPARGAEETLDILVHDKYTHFDPDLVDAFVEVVRKHGWVAAPAEQLVPDPSVPATIDHDDVSLGSGGGATGSAAGPA